MLHLLFGNQRNSSTKVVRPLAVFSSVPKLNSLCAEKNLFLRCRLSSSTTDNPQVQGILVALSKVDDGSI